MSYYLYMKQKGYGCDYTIGCGQRLIKLEAETLAQAKEEIEEHFTNGGYGPGEERELDDAMIFSFEISAMPILKYVLAAEQAEVERVKQEDQKERELAELARLKKKYGG